MFCLGHLEGWLGAMLSGLHIPAQSGGAPGSKPIRGHWSCEADQELVRGQFQAVCTRNAGAAPALSSSSGLAIRSIGDVRSKPLQNEFSDQICRGVSARISQAIQKDQRSAAVG